MLATRPLAFAAAALAVLVAARPAAAQCDAAGWAAPSHLATGGPALAVDLSGTAVALGRPGHDEGGLADVGALDVRRRDANFVWQSELALVPPASLPAVERLGERVALDGERLVATFRLRHDTNLQGFVALERSAGAWLATDLWTAPYGAFGHGRAGFDLDGEWLVVGAPDAPFGGLPASGAVEVRRRVGGLWLPHQVLAAPQTASGAQFGASVALDGTRLVVGAPGANGVHVFELDGNEAWQPVASHVGAPAGHTRVGSHVDVHGLDVVATGETLTGAPAAAVHLRRAAPGTGADFDLIAVVPLPSALGTTSVPALAAGLLVVARPPLSGGGPGELHVFEQAGGAPSFDDRGALAPGGPLQAAAVLGPLAIDGDLCVAAVEVGGATHVRVVELHDVGEIMHACPSVISWTTKGVQFMHLDAGPTHAFEPYWVFGSLSGTQNGFVYAGVYVPLAYDWYTEIGIFAPNSELLYQNLGLLDQHGRATAIYDLPPAVGSWVIGAHAHHVGLVFDPQTLVPHLVSNLTTLTITP